jgi:hypothetical protein
MTTIPAAIPRLHRLFREAAGIDIDKADVKRLEDFIYRKTYDLLLRAVAIAKANARSAIDWIDVPLGKGLQECMHAFLRLDAQAEVRTVLEALVKEPPLDLPYSEELESRLPDIAGALTVALARSFPIIDPDLKNPQSAHWERAFALFDLLV